MTESREVQLPERFLYEITNENADRRYVLVGEPSIRLAQSKALDEGLIVFTRHMAYTLVGEVVPVHLLQAERERVEEREGSLEEWRADFKSLKQDRDKAQETVEELVEALRPFAAMADTFRGSEVNLAMVDPKQLQKARAALARTQEKGER